MNAKATMYHYGPGDKQEKMSTMTFPNVSASNIKKVLEAVKDTLISFHRDAQRLNLPYKLEDLCIELYGTSGYGEMWEIEEELCAIEDLEVGLDGNINEDNDWKLDIFVKEVKPVQ